MNLTALDITILIDTLAGSRGILDGGRVFHYTEKAREDLMEKLIEIAHSVSIVLTISKTETTKGTK